MKMNYMLVRARWHKYGDLFHSWPYILVTPLKPQFIAVALFAWFIRRFRTTIFLHPVDDNIFEQSTVRGVCYKSVFLHLGGLSVCAFAAWYNGQVYQKRRRPTINNDGCGYAFVYYTGRKLAENAALTVLWSLMSGYWELQVICEKVLNPTLYI